MSKKFYETSDFNKENIEWQAKLKKSGFVDIETSANIKIDVIEKQKFQHDPAFLAYNEVCVAFLNSGKIKDKLDLFIFEKHCEGMSNAEISKLLKVFKFRQLDTSTVDRRVLRILSSAGIKPILFNF
jgi:hypothetical protein